MERELYGYEYVKERNDHLNSLLFLLETGKRGPAFRDVLMTYPREEVKKVKGQVSESDFKELLKIYDEETKKRKNTFFRTMPLWMAVSIFCISAITGGLIVTCIKLMFK